MFTEEKKFESSGPQYLVFISISPQRNIKKKEILMRPKLLKTRITKSEICK